MKNSTCDIHEAHETQLNKQENNLSETEMPVNTSPDDQDAVADVGVSLQEPPEENQSVDSVVKTDELNSVPDANVDGAKVAKDNEDHLRGKKRGIHCTTFSNEQNNTEGINLKSVPDCSTGSEPMEVEDETNAGKDAVTNPPGRPDQAHPEKTQQSL